MSSDLPGLGILLSGSGSTYDNLAAACADGRISARIAVVIASKAGIGGISRAEQWGHPLVIANEADAVTAALRQHGAQCVAMCGWLRFWDPPSDFTGRVLNIHPSLLPAFGGKGMYGNRVHEAVLAHGNTLSGCTAHLVAGNYDEGPILAQVSVPVFPRDTVHDLAERVQVAERALYPEVVQALITGALVTRTDGRPRLA